MDLQYLEENENKHENKNKISFDVPVSSSSKKTKAFESQSQTRRHSSIEQHDTPKLSRGIIRHSSERNDNVAAALGFTPIKRPKIDGETKKKTNFTLQL